MSNPLARGTARDQATTTLPAGSTATVGASTPWLSLGATTSSVGPKAPAGPRTATFSPPSKKAPVVHATATWPPSPMLISASNESVASVSTGPSLRRSGPARKRIGSGQNGSLGQAGGQGSWRQATKSDQSRKTLPSPFTASLPMASVRANTCGGSKSAAPRGLTLPTSSAGSLPSFQTALTSPRSSIPTSPT